VRLQRKLRRDFRKIQPADASLFNSGGYVIAAIFICAEYQRLGMAFREHSILAISFWIKLAFIIIEIALAIGA
jgi:hypothetical protein